MSERAVSSTSASEFALSALAHSGDLLQTAARRVEGHDADGVEAVHELRVSIRRVRADLRIFANVFEAVWLEATVAELRDLARLVGGVRDLDVIFEQLETLAGGLAESDRAAAARMLTRLRSECGAARRATLDALRDPARVRAIAELGSIAARRPLAPDADNVTMDDLVAATRHQWRRLRKSVRAAEAEPSAENLHNVRVRAKVLRYSLETLEPVLHRSARRQGKALVALQSHLGELQDVVVIERWLRGVLEKGQGDAFLVGEMVGLVRARGAQFRDGWSRHWREASRKELYRWAH
jgi:CHAD domain-containing protein